VRDSRETRDQFFALQTRLLLFCQRDIGNWPEGTGHKMNERLQGDQFANLRKYAKRLGGWSALRSTVDEGKSRL
jgi:glutathione S-transferase